MISSHVSCDTLNFSLDLFMQCLGELEHNLEAMEASVASSPVHHHHNHHRADDPTAAGATTTAGVLGLGGADGAAWTGAGAGGPLPEDMESVLENGLRQLSVRIGADCRERRAVATHQLDLLKELAAPAHARVLMWLALQVRHCIIS